MNLFLLSPDHTECASWHADFHSKMILESAQLLCSAHPPGAAPYRPTHAGHPCTTWTQRSLGNYRYLVRHARALVRDFAIRSTSGVGHASGAVVEWCAANEPRLPIGGVTGFALAMPEQYRGADAFAAYRRYYLHDKQGYWRKSKTRTGLKLTWVPASWRGRNPPPWWRWLPIPTAPTVEQMKRLKLTSLNGVAVVLPTVADLQPLRFKETT